MKRLGILLLAAGISLCGAAMAAPTEPGRKTDAMPDFDALWNFADPAATEQKFRALLPAAEKSGDLSYRLELETQIARCQGLQGKFDACHATLDAVERLTDALPVARIRYQLERGRAFNSAGQRAKAKPCFLAAWQQATQGKQSGYAIDAAHMLAIVETDLDAQLDWNQKALALAEADPGQDRWLPAILNNLGETYRARKDYERALQQFQRQSEWLRDHGRPADIFNAKDIARMNRLLGRPRIAIEIIEPIAKQLAAKRTPDGYISAEYGQCLVAVGRQDEAQPFLRQAYDVLSKDDYMLQQEPDELARLKRLANPDEQ